MDTCMSLNLQLFSFYHMTCLCKGLEITEVLYSFEKYILKCLYALYFSFSHDKTLSYLTRVHSSLWDYPAGIFQISAGLHMQWKGDCNIAIITTVTSGLSSMCIELERHDWQSHRTSIVEAGGSVFCFMDGSLTAH